MTKDNATSKPYHIDYVLADMNDIIYKAINEYGYQGNGGIYQTSVASGILRKHGHKVGYASEIKEEI